MSFFISFLPKHNFTMEWGKIFTRESHWKSISKRKKNYKSTKKRDKNSWKIGRPIFLLLPTPLVRFCPTLLDTPPPLKSEIIYVSSLIMKYLTNLIIEWLHWASIAISYSPRFIVWYLGVRWTSDIFLNICVIHCLSSEATTNATFWYFSRKYCIALVNSR